VRFLRRRDQPALTGAGGQAAVRAATIFLAVVATGVLVRIFHGLVAPLVVATFLLLLIDALSRDLDSRFPAAPHLLRGFAAGALIIASFAGIILLFIFQGPPFALELRGVEPALNAVVGQAAALVGQEPFTIREIFHEDDPVQSFGRAFAAVRGGVTFLGLVMLYLGFLMASRGAFSDKMDRLFDSEIHREQSRRVFNSIRHAVEQYVRLVTFKALLIALVAFAVMMLMGVRFSLFVAFLVFLAAFVPIVGAFAGALIPALVALAQFHDLTRSLILLGGLGVATALLDNVLMPQLQGDELNIDPLLVLISIGFWGLILGAPGVLLSTPLTVTIMAIASEFQGTRWLAILISKDGEPIKGAK
jgi:AI-2 transport protein TqsA